MMKNVFYIIIYYCILHIPNSLAHNKESVEIDIPYCNSDNNLMYGVGTTLSCANREFPKPQLSFDLSTSSTCNILTSNTFFKNYRLGILKQGKFFNNFCKRRCAHFITSSSTIPCGVRRPPPTYSPLTDWTVKTYNCSNLNLPISKDDMLNDKYLTKLLSSRDPEAGFADTTWEYFRTLDLKGIKIKKNENNVTKTTVMSTIRRAFDVAPNMTVISLLLYKQDGIKPVEVHDLPEVLSLIKNMKKLEELLLAGINISSWDRPHDDLTNLHGVYLDYVGINDPPHWLLEIPNLSFLNIRNMLTDQTNFTILNSLPTLEHFILERSEITKLTKGFLAKSTNLISFSMICSMVSSIEKEFFDNIPNLQFLTIRNNRITSLPTDVFSSLTNLIAFDFYGDGPSPTGTENSVPFTCNDGFYSKQFTTNDTICIDKLPTFSNPEKILGIEFEQCPTVVDELQTGYLKQFPNLEHLRLSIMNITGFSGMGLETLCHLHSFGYGMNPLSDPHWFPQELYLNNVLEITSTPAPASKINFLQFTSHCPALLAMLRENSVFTLDLYYKLDIINNYKNETQGRCEMEIARMAIMYNYTISDPECAAMGSTRLAKVKELERQRVEGNANCAYA